MIIRKGEVTNINKTKGICKVYWPDQGNTSVWLPVLVAADIPQVGDKVLTLHMQNGSVKGFVLGSIYSEDDHWVLPTKYEFYEKVYKNHENRIAELEARIGGD